VGEKSKSLKNLSVDFKDGEKMRKITSLFTCGLMQKKPS